jgi:hypothetical protein
LSLSWQSVIWGVNGFFLLMTIAVAYLPGGSSPDRKGLVQYLAQFTLAEERNLATYWEGWCLLLVAVLAFERFLQGRKTETYKSQSWLGLSVLAAGLSLDELGSIHEQAPVILEPWGFSGSIKSMVPLAVPALLLLIVTLRRMWFFANHRVFWLTLSAFILFGSVAFQEHLEHTLAWPWWAEGIRVGVEEGTELVGMFLLLSVLVSPIHHRAKSKCILELAPRGETLILLKPAVVFVTLLSFIPLAVFTVFVVGETHHRGTPAAWLPFVLLNLSGMAAWACAQKLERYRIGFLAVALLALLFSLDQIIVFERVIDKNAVLGEVAVAMFPVMAAACLMIPILRTRVNYLFLVALLPWSFVLISSSPLLAWVVLPVQAMGLFWMLSNGLEEITYPVHTLSS